jgi:hypothetical protein
VKEQWRRAVEESKRGELRLDLADKLVNILRNEGDIWVKKISNLEDRRNGLLGDAAYCAAMIHIGAAFEPVTRRCVNVLYLLMMMFYLWREGSGGRIFKSQKSKALRSVVQITFFPSPLQIECTLFVSINHII